MRDNVEVIDNNNSDFSEVSTSKFVGKVFGYMGIGLLITAVVCAILNIIFSRLFMAEDMAETAAVVYLGILIGSLVMLLVVSIWIRVSSFFSKRGCAIPFSIYAILMGVMMSALTIFVPGYIVAITLGITTMTFGVMFLIGYFSKKNLSTLAIVASGLALGAFMLIMFNLILFWFFPTYATLATWLASGIIFIAMMMFTIVDIHKIKQIAESGMGNNNVALYCAFTLYVDFIYMFIRILRIVVILFGRKK